MFSKNIRLSKVISAASLAALSLGSITSQAAPTEISNEPLAQAVSSVKPNIMFMLDDSLSMYFQWTPDYIRDWTGGGASDYHNCRPQANSGGTLQSSLGECSFGDVPYNAYEFNTQYYNPNIYYRPSPGTDGADSSSRIMNATNTSSWTNVPNDAYGVNNRGVTWYVDSPYGSSTATTDLTTQIPDRVWCTTQGTGSAGSPVPPDTTDTAICRTNADHTYPDDTYKYGTDLGGNILYKYGAPYYYKVSAPQYCTDATKTNCQASADATHTIVAPVRFCTGSTLTGCQAKRNSTHKYPYFAGTLSPSTLVIGAKATATLAVGNSNSNTSVSITSLLAGSTELLPGPVTAAGGTNTSGERNSAATAIANMINTGAHGYTATSSNNVVTIYAPADGAAYNGQALQQSYAAGTTRSSGTLTVNGVSSGGSGSSRRVTSITVGGVEILGSSTAMTAGNTSTSASDLAAQINNFSTIANGGPWEYTATVSANVVTIYADLSAGATPNGLSISVTAGSRVSTSTTAMSGGVGAANLPTTTTTFTGGVDGSGSAGHWNSDIHFERTDIVPTVGGLPKTFPRASGRTDCASNSYCTYDEEMTNYANWYSYYRTRLQTAKSSSGRAFAALNDSVRVGFITIYPMSGSNVSASKYLKIDDFAYDTSTLTGHKKDWYNKLYGAIYQSTGTPLREALARVGRLYAGKFDGIDQGIPTADDPVQYSCQPNFTIMTTDGYWNGNGGKEINGSTGIGNEDNVDSGYSKRIDGAYDGGGTSASGTLADVAMYYYKTDLRSSMADTVFTTTKDTAPHQHMTTYTLGIGVDGLLDFESNYESENASNPGDFYAIKQGTKNWPVPVAGNETTVDDLWHTAVNGRGTYYTARNPQDFTNGVNDALTQMFARGGAGSAAATSNLQPTAGDNFAFTAEYETSTWQGDLVARTIDTTTGDVATAKLWSAASLLNNRNYSERMIYTFDATDTGGNLLKSFCWPGTPDATCSDGSGLSATEQAYFNPSQLSQSSTWTALQTANASAHNLVDYLRGDRELETTGGTDASDLYRARVSALGDIINAQPAYIKASPFEYDTATNPHYTDFKANIASRLGTVYAAANDGMLHAFETDVNNDPYYQTAGITTETTTDDTFVGNNSGNGEERWAYIPEVLLPNLYKLAQSPYTHHYYADGSPVIGDICVGHTTSTPCSNANSWRTILVAGLNSGGRGYYALDITDPANPKGLWEFTSSSTCLDDTQAASGTYSSDCNLGYTYGNPLIVKRPSDDRWVVIVSSGYNNYNPGDGKGYLYILDAATGKILQRMTTGVGSGGTAGAGYSDAEPSGLGRINGWATNAIENNKVLAVYGGDLLGNVWRFDLDPTSANYNTVFKLATLTDSSGNPQPITTKPELGEVTPYRIILVGTGKYLGPNDPDDTSVQSIYGLRDDASTTEINVRGDLLPRSLIPNPGNVLERNTTAATAMDWLNYKGWYIDLPDSGERVNVDPQLQLGTLIIASNVPSTDSCTAGGYAWLNFFDYKTGTQVSGNPASTKISNALVVGLSTIVTNGTVHTIVTTSDNKRSSASPPVNTAGVSGKRVSWREIISQ